jgi:hypothetical protein
VHDPPRRIERRVRMIAGRMRRRGYLDEAQFLQAIGAPPPAVPADPAVAPSGPAPDTLGGPGAPGPP